MGVFQHSREGLGVGDFQMRSHDLFLCINWVYLTFNQLVESRIRQIIQAAKQQGQSLEATLQNLDRFYEEGILGDLEQGRVP
jgi:hypothetical protein